LPKITEGAGTTIFLPAEATGVMGALGGLRELLTRSNSNPRPAQPGPGAKPRLGSGEGDPPAGS
jgi:hypothetical protein